MDESRRKAEAIVTKRRMTGTDMGRDRNGTVFREIRERNNVSLDLCDENGDEICRGRLSEARRIYHRYLRRECRGKKTQSTFNVS